MLYDHTITSSQHHLVIQHYSNIRQVGSMTRKTRQQYNAIVAKAISSNTCRQHKQPLTVINLTNFKLHCSQCQYASQDTAPVEQLIANPIEAVIVHNRQHDARQLRKQLQQADEYMQVKIGFETMIAAIEDELRGYIGRLKRQFNAQWDAAFEGNANAITEISEVQRRYKAVFDEVLENKFINGTVQQLEEVLNQFCMQRCQDPTPYLQQRVKKIASSTADMPIIEWGQLKHVHEIVCDPSLWTVSKSIKPSFNEQPNLRQRQQQFKNSSMILPGIATALQKQNYWLLSTESNLLLMQNQSTGITNNEYQQKEVSCDDSLSMCKGIETKEEHRKIVLDQINVCHDAYYELSRCRIVGTNYSGLTLYSYCLDHLVESRRYPITGCQNLLVFQDTLILEAQGRILRLWLSDGFKQVVGLAGSNLQYGHNNNEFTYVNGKGDVVTRSAFHNQL